jgi:hypothetical protein
MGKARSFSEEVKKRWRQSEEDEDRLTVADKLGWQFRVANQFCTLYDQFQRGGIYLWVDNGYAHEDIQDLITLSQKGSNLGLVEFAGLSVLLKKIQEKMPGQDDGREREEKCYCGDDDECETCGGDGVYMRDIYEEEMEDFQDSVEEFDAEFRLLNLDPHFVDALLEKLGK